nr:MAG TPA: hypothetical protein [Caudoviricetes sp.]
MSDSFIIYTSYLKIFEQLTDAQLGQLTRHMLSFAKTGEEPNIEDPIVKLSFAFIKDDMERNKRKYEEKCERLRANARKRWDKKQLDTEASEDMQKHTNVCKSMQLHANAQIAMHNDNEYVNDNVDDNDVSKETDILEPSKEASMQSFSEKNVCAVSEPQKSSEKKKSKKGEIDYVAIKDYWNEQHDKTNSAMRRLTLMTDNRKEAIRGRLKDCNGDISQIYLAIDKAMASSYLNAGHSWASYDWVMTRKYFPKVLEGNYDNTKPAASQQPAAAKPQDPAATARPSIGELYEQAKHQQPASHQSQDDKFRWVIQQNLADLKKNPHNKPAKDSLTRYYERGVLQRLGIDWKPEK